MVNNDSRPKRSNCTVVLCIKIFPHNPHIVPCRFHTKIQCYWEFHLREMQKIEDAEH